MSTNPNDIFEGIPISMRVVMLRRVKERNPNLTGEALWEEVKKEVSYINDIFREFFSDLIPEKNGKN